MLWIIGTFFCCYFTAFVVTVWNKRKEHREMEDKFVRAFGVQPIITNEILEDPQHKDPRDVVRERIAHLRKELADEVARNYCYPEQGHLLQSAIYAAVYFGYFVG